MKNSIHQFLIKEITIFIVIPLLTLFITGRYILGEYGVVFWFPWIFLYPVVTTRSLCFTPKEQMPIYAYVVMLLASALMLLASFYILYGRFDISEVQMAEVKKTVTIFSVIIFLFYSGAFIVNRLSKSEQEQDGF